MNFKFLIIIGLLLLIFIIYKRNKNVIVYSVPNSIDPQVFGPSYWRAFHDLAEKVPCLHCREEAKKFMRFFHDTVNKKLGKPLYDENNYNEIKNSICNG